MTARRRDPHDMILEQARTIAVVGLSPWPSRESHVVAGYMQRQGYRIVPVNPNAAAEILGERVYASLAEVPLPVDVVNVFQRSAQTDAPIDAAIAMGARAVWLQQGIRNRAGLERARRAGLLAVEDCCLQVEHARWRAAGGR